MKVIVMCMLIGSIANADMPKDFVDVQKYAPEIIVDLQYVKSNNFVGSPVDGYKANKCYLTKITAKALAKASQDFQKLGYQIVALDCARPQRAVDHFMRWARSKDDPASKKLYYPDLEKSQLFQLGYIASKSGHSRGSTLDMTIVKLEGGKAQPVDMGTHFDFFGTASNTDSELINAQQRSNRDLLRRVMLENGFRNYSKEWWHYTLKNEPYKKTYFDFEIR